MRLLFLGRNEGFKKISRLNKPETDILESVKLRLVLSSSHRLPGFSNCCRGWQTSRWINFFKTWRSNKPSEAVLHFKTRRGRLCVQWRQGDVVGPCLSLAGTLCYDTPPPLLPPRVSSVLWYLADRSYKELPRQASTRQLRRTRKYVFLPNKSADSDRIKWEHGNDKTRTAYSQIRSRILTFTTTRSCGVAEPSPVSNFILRETDISGGAEQQHVLHLEEKAVSKGLTRCFCSLNKRCRCGWKGVSVKGMNESCVSQQ